jgi:hypothetical protein
MAWTADRPSLVSLRHKYSEMLSMRLVPDDDAAAQPRMAQLAKAFPGALRELDDLELTEIRRRVAALDAVLDQGEDVERWMVALVLFHSFARGALCVKRWLLGRRTVDGGVARAFAEEVVDLPFPDEARAWASDLARIASPPGGRLSALVIARVAGALQTSEKEARRLVFGPTRRERRRRGASAQEPGVSMAVLENGQRGESDEDREP